jgi:predicted CXXCH cytochrome family protein
VRIRLRQLTRTRSGKPAAHEERFDADALTIGRGTDNKIQIPGLSVPLHLATVRDRPDGVHVEPTEPTPLTINGRPVQGDHRIRAGDTIRVGQHEIRVLPPAAEERIALEIERVEYEQPETEALLARTRYGIERGFFTRRTLSWLALGGALLLGVTLPLAARAPGRAGPESAPRAEEGPWAIARLAWATGRVSRVHSFTASDCRACHAVPFARVRDKECQACHRTTGGHVAPGRPEPAILARSQCVNCHAEHGGDDRLIARSDATCTGCHGDIRRQMSDTRLENVTGFASDGRHPEFKAVVPAAAGATTCERVPIAAHGPATPMSPREEPLILRAGLRFPHRLHLEGGLRTKWTEEPAARRTTLACRDCHTPDTGGILMRPIRFADHCQSCHDLRFSDTYRDRQTLHPAQPADIEADLFQFFAARALAGEPTLAGNQPTRRRPGAVMTGAERLDALARARRDAAKAKDDLLGTRGIDAKSGNRGACAVCHFFTPDRSRVLPVRLAGAAGRCDGAPGAGTAPRTATIRRTADGRWLEFTTFSHEAHRTTKCESCHRVETAASPTGMLPGRDLCVDCHRHEIGGAKLALDACVQCHRMHIERYGPMHASAENDGSPAVPADGT